MTSYEEASPALLIAGYWLGAWAWEEVTEQLTDSGCRALPVTLPGLDPTDLQRASRTLEDQALAIEQAMAQVAEHDTEPVVIVAHSGANGPVTMVLDRHPERVRRVVWVDTGPAAAGTAFAPDTPETLRELPLPPFEELGTYASLEGLSPEVLERFRARAVPQPGPVVREPVSLSNDARLRVPATFVCCSVTGAQIMEFANSGHSFFAEVARLEHVHLVDLPTGHWPMWSRPSDLAQIIVEATSASRPETG
ncbi:MAG: alpha/beta hydrolase [Propionicimonas sp.]